MANEFINRHGFISKNNSVVSGSLIVTNGVTGSLLGTASWALNSISSSYAVSASHLIGGSVSGDSFRIVTGSVTASVSVGSSSSFIISSGSSNLLFVRNNSYLGLNIYPTYSLHIVDANIATVLIKSIGTTNGTDYATLRLSSEARTWQLATGGPNSSAWSNGFYLFNEGSGNAVLALSGDNNVGIGGNITGTILTGASMIIKASGNVLIGSNADAGYKLDVNGTLRSSYIYSPTLKINGSVNATIVDASDVSRYTIGRSASTGFLEFLGNQTTFSGYKFSTSVGDVMTIANNGDVTLGGTLSQPNLSLTSGNATITFSSNATLARSSGDGSINLTLQNFTNAGFYVFGSHASSVVTTIRGATSDNQLVIGYDVSNYIGIKVSSNGSTTFDAVGSGAKFTFQDTVETKTGTTSKVATVGGKIKEFFTSVGNVGTGEDDLYTYTTEASILNTNGDEIEGSFGLELIDSAGTATRQVKLWFGGTAIFDTGALTITGNSDAVINFTIVRVSATVVRYRVTLTTQGASLAAYTSVGELTGLTLSNTNILKLTGEAAGIGAASNDIVAHNGSVYWWPTSQ